MQTRTMKRSFIKRKGKLPAICLNRPEVHNAFNADDDPGAGGRLPESGERSGRPRCRFVRAGKILLRRAPT